MVQEYVTSDTAQITCLMRLSTVAHFHNHVNMEVTQFMLHDTVTAK